MSPIRKMPMDASRIMQGWKNSTNTICWIERFATLWIVTEPTGLTVVIEVFTKKTYGWENNQ